MCVRVFIFLFIALGAFAQDKPNIVLFFIDDMGYGDIEPFGSTLSKTPHLNKMAKEGAKFTNFYVSSTACTPSRSALLTGCYADRISMDGNVVFPGDKRGLNPAEITIADMLKTQGYTTACIGKWHLGDAPEFMPDKQGFDTYTGIPYSNDMWPGHKNHPPLPFIKNHKTVAHVSDPLSQALLGDALADAAVEFIEVNKDKPFFLYFPHSMVHVPRYVLKERVSPEMNSLSPVEQALKIQIEEIDASVGRVVETLEQHGLSKNTLILFTSDNGGSGATSMGGLRGGKGGPKYEGHMRASTLVKWPAKIPAGLVTHEIASTIDVLPTIASITGGQAPQDRIIDGKDISSLFMNSSAKSPHPYHFYEYEGIRKDNWKLMLSKKKVKKGKKNTFATNLELYDLNKDVSEKNNLASQHPELVKELHAKLLAHKQAVQSNQRPAGFVTTAPKPISTEGLPLLSVYLGRDKEEVMRAGALRGNSNFQKEDEGK
ncbi:MAG: sulfatase-like hydrolase/transferase [Lentisphaerales bacterium]|nr:sulfatase-like hydrolase/transferase [Lentisphaerales bacterium]